METILTSYEAGSDTPTFLRPVGTDQAILLSPIDAYRQSVFDGTYLQDVCEQAEKTEPEWQRDRAIFKRRQDAARALTERLPKQVAAAEAAERAASTPLPTLADDMTVGQLREMIRSIAPRQDTKSYEGFAHGVCLLPGEPLRRKASASNSLCATRFAVQDAEGLLFQTAGKPPENPAADRLRSIIKDVENRIRERQPVLDAERQIAGQRQRIDGLTRGTISITDTAEWSRVWAGPPSTVDQVNRENKRLLAEAKAELARLIALSKQKAAAERENAADRAALVDLQRDLAAAEAETRHWQLRPENMRWSD